MVCATNPLRPFFPKLKPSSIARHILIDIEIHMIDGDNFFIDRCAS